MSECFVQVNSETGEAEVYKIGKNGSLRRQVDRATSRLEKWELLDYAQRILTAHRTRFCLRSRLDPEVAIVQSKTSCRYTGLMVCGSVWHCSVCAARITEYRRKELYAITQRHFEAHKQGKLVMVTNTIPHGNHDDMAALLARFTDAEKRYRQFRPMRHLRERIGLIGTVRGLEWTWRAEHGSHPHTHNLWFVPEPVDHKKLQAELSVLWRKACKKVGLREPAPQAGLMVTDGRVYPAKWGIDHELTKSHIKHGIKGLTPWDLLRWYIREPNQQAAALFNEYANVFKGRRQLFYSHGLKDLYGIDEITDQEIAEGTEEDGILVCKLTPRQWYHVCKRKVRGIVLHFAERGGAELVMAYVASLENGESVPENALRMPKCPQIPPVDLQVDLKQAQNGKQVRVECVQCKSLWWSYEPGAHVCPSCNSHLNSRVLYQDL